MRVGIQFLKPARPPTSKPTFSRVLEENSSEALAWCASTKIIGLTPTAALHQWGSASQYTRLETRYPTLCLSRYRRRGDDGQSTIPEQAELPLLEPRITAWR
jgi:hypothetical protein